MFIGPGYSDCVGGLVSSFGLDLCAAQLGYRAGSVGLLHWATQLCYSAGLNGLEQRNK